MEQDFQKTIFYRSFMTCVFAGLTGTVLSMFYDLFFTQVLNFPLSAMINVSTLIFVINLTFIVIGFLFYGFVSSSRHGETIYRALFILLTAFSIWKLQGVHRTDNDAINIQFRYLSSGIVVILGLLASIGVPFLFHNKQFDKYVL
jgi:hypothetical protein